MLRYDMIPQRLIFCFHNILFLHSVLLRSSLLWRDLTNSYTISTNLLARQKISPSLMKKKHHLYPSPSTCGSAAGSSGPPLSPAPSPFFTSSAAFDDLVLLADRCPAGNTAPGSSAPAPAPASDSILALATFAAFAAANFACRSSSSRRASSICAAVRRRLRGRSPPWTEEAATLTSRDVDRAGVVVVTGSSAPGWAGPPSRGSRAKVLLAAVAAASASARRALSALLGRPLFLLGWEGSVVFVVSRPRFERRAALLIAPPRGAREPPLVRLPRRGAVDGGGAGEL